jgi:predicted patatin/cPLA2 family phospholipase
MRALVLEGGAMRGIFTAGVLDAFAERREPPFDLVVGVSAGACCAASFLSRQVLRNYVIFLEHMTTRSFADPSRMLRGGSLVDMSYLMTAVTYDLYPLDIDAMRGSHGRFESVVTDARTGEPAYLDTKGPDCIDALHATVAMPYFYRGGPIAFRGADYFDGAVSDPVPIARAVALGATHVTVVLTRSGSWRPRPMSRIARAVLSRHLAEYPRIFEALTVYDETQTKSHELALSPLPGVDLRVIMPPADFPVDRFTLSRPALHHGYEMGRRAGLEMTRTALVPPKPNELDAAMSTVAVRDRPAT